MVFDSLKWYIESDVELKVETCWYGKEEKIDGFKFYSKRPFSKSYQCHATIGLENTYGILSLFQKTIRNGGRAAQLQVSSGWGREDIYIWKGSLKKAETPMFEMIKEIPTQY